LSISKRAFLKIVRNVLIIAAIVLFSAAGYLSYQYYGLDRCPACGMLITPDMKEHFFITDGEGNRIYVCCQACMLRILDPVKGYDQIRIETFCDWYGPEYKIIIEAKNHGNDTMVNPDTVVLLLGAMVVPGCGSTRIAYNQTAAEMLLMDGYSKYTMMHQRNQLPEGTPIVTVASAATMLSTRVGITYVAPRPWLVIAVSVIGVIVLAESSLMHKSLESKAKATHSV